MVKDQGHGVRGQGQGHTSVTKYTFTGGPHSIQHSLQAAS